MKTLWSKLRGEPVAAWFTASGTAIGLLTAFDIHVSSTQQAAIDAAIPVLFGLVARRSVTPVTHSPFPLDTPAENAAP